MRRLASFWLAILLSLAGVSCAGVAEPPLAVHMDWGLDGPAGTIPSGVSQLTVLVFVGDSDMPQSSINTVANLDDMDGNGHPDLARIDLPTNVPIRMTIEGQGAGNATLFLGHAGPFTLLAGERRYVDLHMYPVGSFGTTDSAAMTPRMLATATTLSDGRVLISGGFTHAAAMTCPTGVATGSTCIDLTAATDAFIFDIASGALLPVHGGLRQARGGHTATLLPNDRVLIAGGAAHAALVLAPGAETFQPSFLSLDTTAVAATSFEVFDPEANAEAEDVNRDGDPGRGGFVGAADDPSMLGRLDAPRFMHGASAVPGHPSQVLLAGGVDSPMSWVIYDDTRAGGYGVLDSTMNHLQAGRTMPVVAPAHSASGDALWIIGGGDAASDADVAEVWTASAAAPSGNTVAATVRNFPSGSTTVMSHPEFSLTGATAVALDATHALVVGWYGPFCDTTGAAVFAGATGAGRCSFPATSSRSFTLDGMTGRAAPTMTHTRHAFGAGVRMSDGSALFTGGFGSLGAPAMPPAMAMPPVTANTTDHFNAMVPVTGAAQLSDVQPLLMQARAFHAMAPLPDGGVLVVGGLSLAGTTTITATLVGATEVLYLPR